MQKTVMIKPSATNIVLQKIPLKELYEKLNFHFGLTIEHVQEAAIIWRELIRRKEDLSAYRKGAYKALDKVARGEIEAPTLLRLSHNQTLLNTISSFPLDAQKKLLENPISIFRDNKKMEISLEQLKWNEIGHVIDGRNHTVYSIHEQKIRIAKKNQAQGTRIASLVYIKVETKLLKKLTQMAEQKKLSVEMFLSKKIADLYMEEK